jgi:hypothetical protein
MPVFGTVAARFNDDGVTALYQHLRGLLAGTGPACSTTARWRRWSQDVHPAGRARAPARAAVPGRDRRDGARLPRGTPSRPVWPASTSSSGARRRLGDAEGLDHADVDRLAEATAACSTPARGAAREWPAAAELTGPDRPVRSRCRAPTCRSCRAPLVDHGELVRWLRSREPARALPLHRGVFPLKREGEDPARMFAGEGGPARTNRRFHLLSEGQPATRLSTAFDSVTLYGFDPAERPDIYGKVGNSGVSIATLDDMKELYAGFDLCDPSTSVSMTINGPAPTILAMFLNTAIDQHRPVHREHGRNRRRRGRRADGRGCGARARHGAGRHPEGGPGPEHVHLLHRVLPRGDGRHRRSGSSTRGAQLLLGVDLRLPHRRSGREPHQPAGVHPGQRVHLRRVVPGRGSTSTTSHPTSASSSPTAWTPSTRCSAASPGASGRSRCATATGRTSGRRS